MHDSVVAIDMRRVSSDFSLSLFLSPSPLRYFSNFLFLTTKKNGLVETRTPCRAAGFSSRMRFAYCGRMCACSPARSPNQTPRHSCSPRRAGRIRLLMGVPATKGRGVDALSHPKQSHRNCSLSRVFFKQYLIWIPQAPVGSISFLDRPLAADMSDMPRIRSLG